ncbi:three prime repair exonuclease 2 [Bubalus kerabau]|uniref:three prime repair exonuclease 2 n=1 Tax=Bubalus bubalis TaxID=89462 RepID=UPI000DBCA0AE|nr:three prime repair exonuclease 2 [Bubalus bubalis]XP_055420570.1 three prime repair exonuclease 2 [Bubalus carabanensis]
MSKRPRAETFVFLDLEATGLPSVDPEIAELSLFAVHRSSLEDLKCDESGAPLPPRVMDKLTLCMSPERPFTAKASEITGLSREGLGRCGKAGFDSTVVQMLQAFLSRQEGPVCLVAHNGFDYDFPLLCTELRRLGAHLPQDTVCLDTLAALQGLDRAHSHGTRAQGGKSYSLGSLFRRYFQAEPSAAHSAEGDVHTLLMVFLHRATELLAWADKQALSWAHVEPMYVPPDGSRPEPGAQ